MYLLFKSAKHRQLYFLQLTIAPKNVIFATVRPRASIHPGPLHAVEGSNVTLPTCHVTGHPTPVVTWSKSFDQLPQGSVESNNSALTLFGVRRSDSDNYFCAATNMLGKVVQKTLLVVVSLPQFTVKPPAKIVESIGVNMTLNCSASGDPQPVISWKRQGSQLPVGRSQQIDGDLVIRDVQKEDSGNYICVATSAGVFKAESVVYLQIGPLKGELSLAIERYFIQCRCRWSSEFKLTIIVSNHVIKLDVYIYDLNTGNSCV